MEARVAIKNDIMTHCNYIINTAGKCKPAAFISVSWLVSQWVLGLIHKYCMPTLQAFYSCWCITANVGELQQSTEGKNWWSNKEKPKKGLFVNIFQSSLQKCTNPCFWWYWKIIPQESWLKGEGDATLLPVLKYILNYCWAYQSTGLGFNPQLGHSTVVFPS